MSGPSNLSMGYRAQHWVTKGWSCLTPCSRMSSKKTTTRPKPPFTWGSGVVTFDRNPIHLGPGDRIVTFGIRGSAATPRAPPRPSSRRFPLPSWHFPPIRPVCQRRCKKPRLTRAPPAPSPVRTASMQPLVRIGGWPSASTAGRDSQIRHCGQNRTKTLHFKP